MPTYVNGRPFDVIDDVTRTVYVDKNSLKDVEIGTIDHPFKKIQTAVDYVATLIPAPSVSEPVVIFIGAGVYSDPVVVRINGIILHGSHYGSSKIEVSGGNALTITNATAESLAVYDASGVYSDLVNGGSMPRFCGISDINVKAIGVGKYALRVLGVKGDNTATKTDFLRDAFFISRSRFQGSSGAVSAFIKNSNYLVQDYAFMQGGWVVENVSFLTMRYCYHGGNGTIRYISGGADGEPFYGKLQGLMANCSQRGADFTLEGEATLAISNSEADDTFVRDTAILDAYCSIFDSVTVEDSAVAKLHGSYVETNVSTEALSSFLGKGSHIEGTATAAIGAGVVSLADTSVEGTITDAGAKIVYSTSNVRSGTATAAGPGDIAVAFSPALSRANYRVSLGNIGSAGAVVKDGTKTINGFTLTFAAAGDCDWSATLR